MTDPKDRLFNIKSKINRAKEHIDDLNREVTRFLETRPYTVACKMNPETRRPIYYVSEVRPVPIDVTLIAGDAIHNLWSALDYLAFQIVRSGLRGDPPNPSIIYFPIFGTEVDKAAIKSKIPGARQESVDAIAALKPYKGGNDTLWTLSRLNNIQKHRNLLAVGSKSGGFDISKITARNMASIDSPSAKRAAEIIASMAVFIHPADDGFPLEPGFELLAGGVDDECDPNQQFRFDVAIYEPGIIERESIVDAFKVFADVVDGVVENLSAHVTI